MNESSSLNISTDEYTQKINALLEFYKAVSEKVDHFFCFPIKTGDTWNIHCFYRGQEYLLDYSKLKSVVNVEISCPLSKMFSTIYCSWKTTSNLFHTETRSNHYKCYLFHESDYYFSKL